MKQKKYIYSKIKAIKVIKYLMMKTLRFKCDGLLQYCPNIAKYCSARYIAVIKVENKAIYNTQLLHINHVILVAKY